jgi:uncharacterized protein YbjT (DUF2867 family)
LTNGTREIFVTGGTGYIGRPLITALLARGHRVRALARAGSESRVPTGAQVVMGNALDAASFAGHMARGDTLVHLIGTSHPSPTKAAEFKSVDRASAKAAVAAACQSGAAHFIYVSVAQPAPVMKDYIDARAAGEAAVRASEIDVTILRPWYVLGPGHWWPITLIPAYALARLIPATRENAIRLGLVTLREMVAGLVWAVEHAPAVDHLQILDVPRIRERAR